MSKRQQSTGGDPVGQWIPQIAVDDIHAVAATCVEMGGAVIAAIRRVSDDDPGLMCTIRDPEGAVLGLIQVAKD
jgi:predicted enzyme related to lactoylglutathione lyase